MRHRRIIALCLPALIILSCAHNVGAAEPAPPLRPETSAFMESRIAESGTNFYGKYLSENTGAPLAVENIKFVQVQNKECTRGIELRFEAEIASDAKYELQLAYTATKPQNIIIRIETDGKSPFSESERLTFPTFWVNAGESRRDGAGNEFAPNQILYDKTVTSTARDYSGRYENPYLFALSAGIHTFTLTVIQGEFTLNGITLSAPEQAKQYESPKQEENPGNAQADPIIIEGESAVLKNDRSLIPISDVSSPAVNPADPVVNKLNYIGGANWRKPGSALSWDFEVKSAGYYSVGFLCRQNQLLGGVSYRHLTIDGITPFDEAKRIKFTYDSSWQYTDFAGGDAPYLIYLNAGPHTLTLTATAGAMSEVYSAMRDVTALMGDLYVDITMIVGETVDIYRSYELFNQIPDFNGRLDQAIQSLDGIATKLEALQEQNSGSTVSIIRNAVRVVRQMRDNPYSAHRYKDGFYDAYTNLSALMGSMTDTPLDIDRIIFNGAGVKAPDISSSLFERTWFALCRFFASFFSDYNMISGGTGDAEALTIWVNWGRDQAQALNAVIQDGFVRDTGIPVSVSVVNATLIQAILAGNGPDCMLEMTRTEPVNLAMRGALVDLSRFDDLPDILKRFTGDAAEPFQYQGGVYALPDTQNFFMMFTRKDILDGLGIKQPETWEDYIGAATLLQRSNLQAYLPYTQITDSGTVNTGVGGLTLYPTLLTQNGLSLYNEGHTASTLSEFRQLQVFTDWVGWYTKYKLPVTMDFYNRFRIGSAPIGIAPYTLYTQLKAAAPEIDGRWTVTPIPGVKKEDGSIYRSSAGSGTGCSITKLSKSPENAWEFLKWWTSAETQLKYSNNVESAIGPLGRVATANTEAFANMDWDAEMLEQMLIQRKNMVQIPEIPGGYYTARGIDQAFWGVVEQGQPPTETLTKWSKAVDREIARKRAEYVND